jgi:hypothetical protein
MPINKILHAKDIQNMRIYPGKHSNRRGAGYWKKRDQELTGDRDMTFTKSKGRNWTLEYLGF